MTSEQSIVSGEIDSIPDRLWDLVLRRSEISPDAPMLIEGDERMTFGEFRDRAEAAARGLRSLGVAAESVVAWQLPTSIEAVVLMGALARLGAIQVPLIPLLRHREVRSICRSTGVELLVVPATWRGFDHAQMAREIADESGQWGPGRAAMSVTVIDHLGEGGDLSDQWPAPPGVVLDPWPDDAPHPERRPVRWIFHSSGTTADPKGCMHTDRSVMHSATGLLEVLGFTSDDVYPIAYPWAHIGGVTAMTTQLMAGSQVALHSSFDPELSPGRMSAEGATVLGSALPFFRAYLAAQRAHGEEPLFPGLRACVGGGAPKPPELHLEVAEILGGAGILGSWGLTECPVSTFTSPTDPERMLALCEGRPVSGVQVRVDSAEDSIEGELLVRGPQLFSGYVDPEMNVGAFTDDGFFRTGDLGVIHPSGHVQITGRLKDVIIRNAENISALEIENAIRTHPSVVDVAVVGLPDSRTGERACAVIVLADGAEPLGLAELGRHCVLSGLAVHKQPEQMHVVAALPRNALGKLLKREVTLMAAGPGTVR